MSDSHEWAIIGAGPAGIAAVGCLLDAGVDAKKIVWLDPAFKVGDFGQHWGNVSSNTTVEKFSAFLSGFKAFNYSSQQQAFELDKKDPNGFSELKQVATPLQWITDNLRKQIDNNTCRVERLSVQDGNWQLQTSNKMYQAEKVILATGAEPLSLHYDGIEEIPLVTALDPEKLAAARSSDDTIAVFGSSHSAMIIIHSLLELGVKKVINFYREPIRYAVPMDGWILYDNTGLKGETARWVHAHISKNCHPQVERYLSTDKTIADYLPQCNKAVYAIGFKQRVPQVEHIELSQYDTNHGIIAPGLFGTGIGFPKLVTDPHGRQELNVGLYKFMNDLRSMVPIWLKYDL